MLRKLEKESPKISPQTKRKSLFNFKKNEEKHITKVESEKVVKRKTLKDIFKWEEKKEEKNEKKKVPLLSIFNFGKKNKK